MFKNAGTKMVKIDAYVSVILRYYQNNMCTRLFSKRETFIPFDLLLAPTFYRIFADITSTCIVLKQV